MKFGLNYFEFFKNEDLNGKILFYIFYLYLENNYLMIIFYIN